MTNIMNSVLLLMVFSSLHLNRAVRFVENKQLDRFQSLLSEQDVQKVLSSELTKNDKAVLEEFDKLKSLIHKAKLIGKSHGSKLKPKTERNMGADDDSLSEPSADRIDQENNVIAFDDEVKGSKFDTENNLLLLEHIYKVLSVLRSLNNLKSTDSSENLNLLSDYTSEHRQIIKKSEDDETLKERQSSNTSPFSQFNDKINKCIENLQDLHQQFYSDQSYDTDRRGRTGTKSKKSI